MNLRGGPARGGPAGWIVLAALLALTPVSCGDPGRDQAVDRLLRPTTTTALAPASLEPARTGPSIELVTTLVDPRLDRVLRAAESWRQAQGPRRRVIDQVCLVPDQETFLAAIAEWDEHTWFPILLDDPAWTLPFLRAFRPARVLRLRLRREPGGAAEAPPLWPAALLAVARAWTSNARPDADLPAASEAPRRLSPTPPGLVLSYPESPLLMAAVALAAGRFQPLVRLEPLPAPAALDGAPPAPSARIRRFHDVLSLPEARQFARQVEARASAVAGRQLGLGDRCDFLTLAGEWPYRYLNDAEQGNIHGEHALDDLVGRFLETDAGGLAESRTRWALTGRLVGDSAAGLYRAMCALFLRPEASLLWDTYHGGRAWSDYQMDDAVRSFGRLWPMSAACSVHRSAAAAGLSAWHQALDPVSRFDWIMVNSSGGPRQFSIDEGPGYPGDLPRGAPAAVAIVHSFSAADPTDPWTLAGRWLQNGAFIYYGAMNEPYLQAFRPPRLVAELALAEMPLSAALRQTKYEPFGRAWRLAYLGDPLFRLQAAARHPADADRRAEPRAWRPQSGWDVQEITARTPSAPFPAQGDAAAQLARCMRAAIGGLCLGAEARAELAPARPAWLAALLRIDRRALEPALRPRLDELATDSLLDARDPDGALGWLLKIPPEECGPRVWQAIDTLAMGRVAVLARTRSVPAALDLWDKLIRRPWPAASGFPAQLTGRVAALVDTDPARYRGLFRERLQQAADALARRPQPLPHTRLIEDQRKRLEGPPPAGSRP